MGCYKIDMGASGLQQNIIVKGETGNRDDVVICGANPALDPDFWHTSEYGGPSPCGIGAMFNLTNVNNVVFADLSIVNSPGKMFKLDALSTSAYPRNLIIHNVKMVDCGSQFIKGSSFSPPAARNRHHIIECSQIKYSDALFASNYESQAVDYHDGANITVRNCLFENMRMTGSQNAACVLLWDNMDSAYIYNNMCLNYNWGFRFGLMCCGAGPSNSVYIWNNIMVYDDSDSRFNCRAHFNIDGSVSRGYVYHNTIWSPASSAGLSSASLDERNNLVTRTNSSWFVNTRMYNFNLTSERAVSRLPQVTLDAAGHSRSGTASAGALEYEYPSTATYEPDLITSAHGIEVSPNPFSTSVEIEIVRSALCVVRSERTSLAIYDIKGRLVYNIPRTTNYEPRTKYTWSPKTSQNGTYLVRVQVGDRVMTKRIILIR
jgi:hypothetical protein